MVFEIASKGKGKSSTVTLTKTILREIDDLVEKWKSESSIAIDELEHNEDLYSAEDGLPRDIFQADGTIEDSSYALTHGTVVVDMEDDTDHLTDDSGSD